MSAAKNGTAPQKKDVQLSPAPSVLDAVKASRGDRVVDPVEEHAPEEKAPEQKAEPKTPVAKAPVAKAAEKPVKPAAEPDETASVTAELRARRQRSEAALAEPVAPTSPSSVDDLGRYGTRVMLDARAAAAEFLASVDADAARRAATVSAQAEIEARSLVEAAEADADKIRADARLEADRVVAARLRVAVDLTDQLYRQAEQILADADRPDVARRNLARFVTALTQTAEDAATAAATATDDPSRS